MPTSLFSADCLSVFDQAVSQAGTASALFPSPEDWRDQWIYFVMVDRFNNRSALPRHQPFDDPGFFGYQGGRFSGVRQQLPYIKQLGAGAIWLSPVLKNLPFDQGSYLQLGRAISARSGHQLDIGCFCHHSFSRLRLYSGCANRDSCQSKLPCWADCVSSSRSSTLTPTCSSRSISSRTLQFPATQLLPARAAPNCPKVCRMNSSVSFTTDHLVSTTGGLFGVQLTSRTPAGISGKEASNRERTASRFARSAGRSEAALLQFPPDTVFPFTRLIQTAGPPARLSKTGQGMRLGRHGAWALQCDRFNVPVETRGGQHENILWSP